MNWQFGLTLSSFSLQILQTWHIDRRTTFSPTFHTFWKHIYDVCSYHNWYQCFQYPAGRNHIACFSMPNHNKFRFVFFLQLFITNGLSIKSWSFFALGLTGKHWKSEALNGLGYRQNTFASSREWFGMSFNVFPTKNTRLFTGINSMTHFLSVPSLSDEFEQNKLLFF